MIDFLIIGAGLFGATFARLMTDQGAKCLVLEKRDYIGGNCADEMRDGIMVNLHGGHIFHTNNEKVWHFVNCYADFWQYRHRVIAKYQHKVYSLPINLHTIYQFSGMTTPEQARNYINKCRVSLNGQGDNLESWALSQVGEDIYETLIKNYTMKQWGCDPRELPSSIVKRIPIRLTWDDNYFADNYQGMPVHGYSGMIGAMLKGIEVWTNTDWLELRRQVNIPAKHIIYTGPLDELYDCDLGALDYRSLRWEMEEHQGDYQGIATVNYTDDRMPYTRIIEYKHFMLKPPKNHTLIAKEYPLEWRKGGGLDRYYPIPTPKNIELAASYKARARYDGITLGGRLATYKYIDMHQAIAAAMKLTERFNG